MENSTKSLRLALSKIRDDEMSGLDKKITLLSDSRNLVQSELDSLTKELSEVSVTAPSNVFEQITVDARKADLQQQIDYKQQFMNFIDTMKDGVMKKYDEIAKAKEALNESKTLDEMYDDVKSEAQPVEPFNPSSDINSTQ